MLCISSIDIVILGFILGFLYYIFIGAFILGLVGFYIGIFSLVVYIGGVYIKIYIAMLTL